MVHLWLEYVSIFFQVAHAHMLRLECTRTILTRCAINTGCIYYRVLKERKKHDDRVEILRPQSKSDIQVPQDTRGMITGSRASAVSPKQQHAQVATLNSLKGLEDGLSDQEKLASLMAMRQECENGDMLEKQETRALLGASRRNQTSVDKRSRVFSGLDDYEEDEMLVELDDVVPAVHGDYIGSEV